MSGKKSVQHDMFTEAEQPPADASDEVTALAARLLKQKIKFENGRVLPIDPLEIVKAKPETVPQEVLPSEAAEAIEAAKKPTASATPPSKKIKTGDMLREARVKAEYELWEVAQETKVNLAYLEAIEANEYGELPSRTHAVGFVRSYAEALNLDADDIVTQFRLEIKTALPQSTPQLVAIQEAPDTQVPGSSLITFCIVAAVMVYAIGYSFFRPSTPSETYASTLPAAIASAASTEPAVTAAASAAPSVPASAQRYIAQLPNTPASQPLVTPPVPAAATPAAQVAALPPATDPTMSLQQGLTSQTAAALNAALPKPNSSRIRLQALKTITVQIFDSTGHLLAERAIKGGEAFFIPDKTNYTLATNNAGAMRLQVDGRDLPPLGAPEEPMHNIPLNAEELLAAMN